MTHTSSPYTTVCLICHPSSKLQIPRVHGTLPVSQAQQALRALQVLWVMYFPQVMHLMKALRTQQVPQEVGALLALRQVKVSRVPTGKCIIFKHAQKRCCIAELFLDFVFAHERKPIKPEIYRKFTKPVYSCLNVFQGKKKLSRNTSVVEPFMTGTGSLSSRKHCKIETAFPPLTICCRSVFDSPNY